MVNDESEGEGRELSVVEECLLWTRLCLIACDVEVIRLRVQAKDMTNGNSSRDCFEQLPKRERGQLLARTISVPFVCRKVRILGGKIMVEVVCLLESYMLGSIPNFYSEQPCTRAQLPFGDLPASLMPW